MFLFTAFSVSGDGMSPELSVGDVAEGRSCVSRLLRGVPGIICRGRGWGSRLSSSCWVFYSLSQDVPGIIFLGRGDLRESDPGIIRQGK